MRVEKKLHVSLMYLQVQQFSFPFFIFFSCKTQFFIPISFSLFHLYFVHNVDADNFVDRINDLIWCWCFRCYFLSFSLSPRRWVQFLVLLVEPRWKLCIWRCCICIGWRSFVRNHLHPKFSFSLPFFILSPLRTKSSSPKIFSLLFVWNFIAPY